MDSLWNDTTDSYYRTGLYYQLKLAYFCWCWSLYTHVCCGALCKKLLRKKMYKPFKGCKCWTWEEISSLAQTSIWKILTSLCSFSWSFQPSRKYGIEGILALWEFSSSRNDSNQEVTGANQYERITSGTTLYV